MEIKVKPIKTLWKNRIDVEYAKHWVIRNNWNFPALYEINNLLGKNNQALLEKLNQDMALVDVDDKLIGYVIETKMIYLAFVKEHFTQLGIPFDEFNGLPPTRDNILVGYEFGAVYIFALLCQMQDDYNIVKKLVEDKTFYSQYGELISAVFKKYPNITGSLIMDVSLTHPEHKFLDYANMDDADFDGNVPDKDWNEEKANAFRDWLFKWTYYATDKDKLRVKNWFIKKKSHKQIFAEIQKVAGNPNKFNCRLALFVERLLNDENTAYFYEKTGFDSKEDLLMAYFERLTMFDDETKKSFIRMYLTKEK